MSIKSLNIKKFINLENIKINNIENCKEIYILGDNGVGKTNLLKALAVSAYKNKGKSVFGVADLILNSDVNCETSDDIIRMATYGVNRDNHRYAISTQDNFDNISLLLNKTLVEISHPISTIQRIDLLSRMDKYSISEVEILDTINYIFGHISNNEIKIIFDNDSVEYSFYANGSEICFNDLSDGHRCIFGTISDLLFRLIFRQSAAKNISDLHGIILVDEIELLLHPKAQYTLVRCLREILPNVQWIFTTNSPTIIQGSSSDAVYYKLYKEDGNVKISEQWTHKDIQHLMLNGIITSPLFGMETARMAVNENKEFVDTSASYIQGVINDTIKKCIDLERSNGKQYFSKEEIDKMIEDSVNSLKK